MRAWLSFALVFSVAQVFVYNIYNIYNISTSIGIHASGGMGANK